MLAMAAPAWGQVCASAATAAVAGTAPTPATATAAATAAVTAATEDLALLYDQYLATLRSNNAYSGPSTCSGDQTDSRPASAAQAVLAPLVAAVSCPFARSLVSLLLSPAAKAHGATSSASSYCWSLRELQKATSRGLTAGGGDLTSHASDQLGLIVPFSPFSQLSQKLAHNTHNATCTASSPVSPAGCAAVVPVVAVVVASVRDALALLGAASQMPADCVDCERGECQCQS